MAKQFRELESKMSPASVARSDAMAKEMMAEMLLSEMRKQSGVTQQQLAEALGIKQPALSGFESQTDMQVSTLRRLIEALGGQLELIAHLPHGDVRIGQFSGKAG